jgi:hypothetical protein
LANVASCAFRIPNGRGRSGGDLHIEAESAEHATLANELEFSKDLKDRIGDQRVDVVVRAPHYTPRAIDEIAVRTGMMPS